MIQYLPKGIKGPTKNILGIFEKIEKSNKIFHAFETNVSIKYQSENSCKLKYQFRKVSKNWKFC